jgi:hypothetical protein
MEDLSIKLTTNDVQFLRALQSASKTNMEDEGKVSLSTSRGFLSYARRKRHAHGSEESHH